ncbi:S-adenosyl-L-methionine-dependent methyltransferase [Helicostylum pulchrum]|uniref:Methyltransferase type 11 domain-containing protein n=1 Tax=Helicostylum pulchrum TaxID=562976 RepID=A0ABP9XNI5_9FUNG|nr:S-adenosyl-L-methionine-dependent methyltransferase [Helicostylum pulchrum]
MTDNWSASNYVKHASFVPKLGNIILDMLDAQPTEHVLDFGCGDGVLTKELATRCKSVIGIDASRRMITSANQDKPENTSYMTVDGYDLDTWFNQTQNSNYFDAVFSNATLHWLKRDPVKVIKNIRHVLKPQGRFVAEFGGFMNCGEIQTGLISALNRRGLNGQSYSPWFFPSAEYYSKLLTENGFQVVQAELCPRITELNTDIVGWIEMFGFDFLKDVPVEEHKQVALEVQEHLRPSYQREDGKWCIMYNRLRVIAIKK